MKEGVKQRDRAAMGRADEARSRFLNLDKSGSNAYGQEVAGAPCGLLATGYFSGLDMIGTR